MLNRSGVKSFWPMLGLLALAQCGGAAAPRDTGGAGGSDEGGSGGEDSGGTGGGTGGKPATGGKGGDTGGSGGSTSGGSGGAGDTGGTGGASGGSGGGDTGGSGGEGGLGGEGGSMGGTGGGSMPPPSDEPPLPACKNTVQVANAGALAGALSGAKAGDCLVLADGSYGAFSTSAKGTAQAPIVIRAANKLKASVTGVVKLDNASYVVLEGLTFPGGAGTSIGGNADHVRVTRSRYNSGSAHFEGTAHDNRVDHCEFGPKANDGNLVQPTGMSTNTRIDHNYLHDVSASGANGRETVRLGCCGATFDYHDTGNIVEHNLFVNCSGEAEMISIKSSANIVRYNTVRTSAGNISLRAGRHNTIYGNYVFGTGNQGGIRMYEDDHKIFNNYIATGSALIANRADAIHAAVKNALIVNNTFLGSVALTGSGNTFANNITSAAPSIGGATGGNNLLADAAGLTKMGELMVIAAGSKAIDASMGNFPFVMDDVNGQPRNKPDIGADELSTAPMLYRPLTPADVGPDGP
jgi:poly(beta-D-mannuronate) lyase